MTKIKIKKYQMIYFFKTHTLNYGEKYLYRTFLIHIQNYLSKFFSNKNYYIYDPKLSMVVTVI